MISVVVPLLNEEHSLEALYHEIAAVLDSQPEPYEVVFVDDGSTDASRAVLERLHAETTNVVVVHLRRNFGKARRCRPGSSRLVATSSSPWTPTSRTTRPRSRSSSPSSTRASTSSRLEVEAERSVDEATALARLQLGDRGRLRGPPPRRELRPEGVQGRGPARHADLRRAPPLHPRPRLVSRLPGRRDPREPPRAAARTLAVRARSGTSVASSTFSASPSWGATGTARSISSAASAC